MKINLIGRKQVIKVKIRKKVSVKMERVERIKGLKPIGQELKVS